MCYILTHYLTHEFCEPHCPNVLNLFESFARIKTLSLDYSPAVNSDILNHFCCD